MAHRTGGKGQNHYALRGKKATVSKRLDTRFWSHYNQIPASVRAVFDVMHPEEKQPEGDEKVEC
ncbi:hypothetical protein LCGC14_2503330 [marine sediment metagenome]|uniref:Uncharacterized protein n=1 Tax=marine sediment metagenome TaxID=412755 RepID=A0A0F9DUW5_9ZZZZ